MAIAIQVENLSKAYQLGEIGTGTLSRDIERWFAKVRGKEDPFLKIGEANDRTSKGSSDVVWSLRDINFEIQQGDAVGIIGRNGAGKSTLLKLLSRVTSPTTGSVKVKGRIASLLEVGTGFHPELTGKENIYLNGAILGMRKKEITRKFDEIVDFAGVERYIDTPVKRYSSGMYVRLAFAVAAHLESEILIVDEVLAVGDAEFQRKCLGKMGEVSRGEGRTVLFVSHNMQSVSVLTSKCIYLENGLLSNQGKTEVVIKRYLESGNQKELFYVKEKEKDKSTITKVFLKTSEPNNTHINRKGFEIHIEVNICHPLRGGAIAVNIINQHENSIVHTWLFDSEQPLFRAIGCYELTCTIQDFRLYMGKYYLNVTLAENNGKNILDNQYNICPFNIEMFSLSRDYEWQADSCVYIEDFKWRIS